ncbi:hypothetical protein OG728_39310 (plasmid) [Streptomyces microflavus]|uniref:hypothetical protein n=1 Tax=Streptomyces microflavus TaxID=1919 RepID=UPI002E128D4F|nr:hypothetical protein OG728_39310 [Streptomyces microflavus]
MPSSLATPPAEQEAEFHPGHSPILEPPEGPQSALACTCGGLLELKPATKQSHMGAYYAHVQEMQHELIAL